jgi:hypothetical protein
MINNAQIVLSPAQEELEINEVLVIKRDIDAGYTFSLPESIKLKEKDWKKFISDINTEIGNYEVFDYSSDKNKIYLKIKSKDFMFYVLGDSKEFQCTATTTSEKIANDIWKIYIKHLKKEGLIKIFIDNYYVTKNSLTNNSKILKIEDLNYINDLYYPYINIKTMFGQFFTGSENILLCVGIPGVGKSKLATLALKFASENPDKIPYDKFLNESNCDCQYINVVFVKGTDVLTRDDFWRALELETPDFVIMDDLDHMLTKRDTEIQNVDDIEKNKFLNQFLSFTDGVEKYKTKFIITTNQNYDKIDTALLRKGRLFDILELRELTREEAKKIWIFNSLDIKIFENVFKESTILPAELGSEISKRKNKRIKNACESYLKEDGISKLQQAKRSKKISI